jgi:hypothetical protein
VMQGSFFQWRMSNISLTLKEIIISGGPVSSGQSLIETCRLIGYTSERAKITFNRKICAMLR